MTDLGPIEEDVRFARAAEQERRGVYAGKFTGRMTICANDAHRVAAAMRDAADKLDELAVLAREEQDRRELARAWKVEHDAWQRREDDKGMFESFTDGVGITDYDEPVCPVGPPKTEPRHTILAPTATDRGQ
jgi:hypothetical protein